MGRVNGKNILFLAIICFSFIKKMLFHFSRNLFCLRYLLPSFFWKNKVYSNLAKSLAVVYESNNVCRKIWFCNEATIVNETSPLSLKKTPSKPYNSINLTLYITSDLQPINSSILIYLIKWYWCQRKLKFSQIVYC